MNIKKVLFTSGTLVLAVAAVFAGVKKNAHKFTNLTTVYATAGSLSCATIKTNGSGRFTTGGGNVQATIRTSSGGAIAKKLWTSCAGTTAVSFHL
jgi:hypothetical protein